MLKSHGPKGEKIRLLCTDAGIFCLDFMMYIEMYGRRQSQWKPSGAGDFFLNFHMLSVYFVFSTWSQLAPNWIVIFIEVFIT